MLQTVWESPVAAKTVLARRRIYESLLHVPHRSGRLSGTIADSLGVSSRCPDDHDIVADCLGVSCRCPDGFGTVSDCL
ncbi:hypothetical protein DPMN_068651 [Dreissena polymorpha]|uniref:Uncharacterized protein n=1 Tax=Dreissena polymorpha TaxID=45954 RepID=A0A9D4BUD1_DREPO|nr:hypothetical protein DPMN_068651 [Dreissena polymorpha]